MTIREKLLVKLAQDPAFEGNDETEKALVAELKSEMNSNTEGPQAQADLDIQKEAKSLVSILLEAVAESTKKANTISDLDRKDVDNPQKGFTTTAEFDTEVRTAAKAQGARVETEKEFNEFKKAYRFSSFVKALYNKDFARVKALSEGTDADGGYLVPDDFRAELIQHINASDSIRRYATVIPMQGKYLEIPKLSADVNVYWGTENKAIATTTADFGNVVLTPFRMNAIIRTSRELFDDSALAIMQILSQRFRDRVADEENRVFLVGNGTTQPKGINQETFRSVSAANALTPDHITGAFWKLPEAYRNTARWIVNSRVMNHLETAKESGTGAYLYPSLQGEVKTLKGRPVIVLDHQPSSKITLGDLSFYYIGDREQMSMEVSTEEGNTWAKYQVSLRVIERLDGEVALTIPFVQVTNTNIH